jgi:hypothetical protein
MKYYKILVNGKSCNGGDSTWFLPKGKRPGKWMPKIEGELKLCEHGYHLVKAEEILEWVKEDCQIFEAEPKGKVTYDGSKGVCRSARLLKQLNWNDKIARLFACDCAERVLPIFEKNYPDDKRPRVAIETVRRYVNGLSGEEELAAAEAAAGAARAARGAAWAAAEAAWAARAAAEAAEVAWAARAAAWATETAAWAAEAAWAARAAAWAARAAAWAAEVAWAARAAAWATETAAWAAAEAAWAARAAAWAARAAEKKWQVKRLLQYLNGKVG